MDLLSPRREFRGERASVEQLPVLPSVSFISTATSKTITTSYNLVTSGIPTTRTVTAISTTVLATQIPADSVQDLQPTSISSLTTTSLLITIVLESVAILLLVMVVILLSLLTRTRKKEQEPSALPLTPPATQPPPIGQLKAQNQPSPDIELRDIHSSSLSAGSPRGKRPQPTLPLPLALPARVRSRPALQVPSPGPMLANIPTTSMQPQTPFSTAQSRKKAPRRDLMELPTSSTQVDAKSEVPGFSDERTSIDTVGSFLGFQQELNWEETSDEREIRRLLHSPRASSGVFPRI
jgi:hypothetical protein